MRPAFNFPTRFLRFFFYLIYQPMAWSYDLVAWLVSLGQWKSLVFSTLPWLPGPRILELGHGPGHLQAALHQAGFIAFGLDESRQMGRLAGKRLAKAGINSHLARGFAQHLPYPVSSFDQVVSTFPSEYLFQDDTLGEAWRVLRPFGRLVVLPVAWIRSQRLLGRLAAWLFRVTGQAEAWNTVMGDQLRQAGFVVEEKRITLPQSEVVLLIAQKVE